MLGQHQVCEQAMYPKIPMQDCVVLERTLGLLGAFIYHLSQCLLVILSRTGLNE